MAIIGVSKPIIADYTATGNTVTYSNYTAAIKATEYQIEVETSEDNDLYADNMIVETAMGNFSSGTLTLSTDNLTAEVSKSILGAKEVTRTVGSKSVKELVFDDDQSAQPKGYGIIEKHQINNVTKYMPIVLPKVKFNTPGRSATTQGSEIEWQTTEITAKILRSDQVDTNYNHPWQISPEELYDTEADAESYIKAVLGGTTAAASTTSSTTGSK